MVRYLIVSFVFIVSLGAAVACFAQEKETFTLIIKDHKFDPTSLRVPADQRFKIKVENQDPTAEEFESYDLNREKVVNGNKEIIVFLGPLSKGTYKYFGDFHQNTAQGSIIAQ